MPNPLEEPGFLSDSVEHQLDLISTVLFLFFVSVFVSSTTAHLTINSSIDLGLLMLIISFLLISRCDSITEINTHYKPRGRS